MMNLSTYKLKFLVKKLSVLALLFFSLNLVGVSEVNAQSGAIPFITSTYSASDRITETWVFTVGGQSNMRPNTGTGGNSNTETYPNDALQWGRFSPNIGVLMPATVPLEHFANDNFPQFGPGMITRFANRMKEAYPHVRLVFIPCAKGSSGFASNDWNKGNYYYEDMVSRTNACMTANPDFIYKGFLWHQGENDQSSSAAFPAAFNQFNSDWRADITAASSETIFVCGGLLPSYMDANPGARTVNNFLADVPNNIDYSGFADSETPTVLTGHDSVHFNSDSSLTLGDRYFEAFQSALTNTGN